MATKAQCESALRIYAETLLAFKNVVSVGTAPRDESERRGAGTGAATGTVAATSGAGAVADFAVAVYVTRKVPIEELEDDDVVPSFLQVRDATGLYKVPTRVIERPVDGATGSGSPAPSA